MPSFGRLQAALAAATNEVTVAAANLNFDFTLIKCEAPKEFQALGNTLSQGRKDNAEGGSTHITARRLGVLFEGMLPSTPSLVKSYGTRVSEIAQASEQNKSPELENSMLAAHVGVDGTSIWAAATSSSTALQVQLLACMLARLWSASEATSIWFELVKERRKQVETLWKDEAPLPYSTVAAAAQSDISRTSLAEWDASARSWLRTADRVNQRHQDRLMDLLGKINMPINQDTVYRSVISVWKSALETMESLINGMPQAVNEGSCLLGLSAWHLYPVILVAGSTTAALDFSDPLVQTSGTLTLGLAPPGDTKAHGVFWSLSLAHLNFYGPPVSREARFGFDSRKISFQQFTQAVFGSLLAHWRLTGPMAEYPARFLISLRQAVGRHTEQKGHSNLGALFDGSHPLNILSTVAAAYLDAKPFSDDLIHKLIALGGKRASRFIPRRGIDSFLGFGSLRDILRCLKGANERVIFLRRLASSSPYDPDAMIIRYFEEVEEPGGYRTFSKLCAFASAQGRRHPGTPAPQHARWAPRAFLDRQAYTGEHVSEMDDEISLDLAAQPREFALQANDATGQPILQKFFFVCGFEKSAAIFMQESSIYDARLTESLTGITPDVPAPYRSQHHHTESLLSRGPNFDDLIWCLKSGLFAVDKLMDLFDRSKTDISPVNLTLESLSTAHQIYRSLPDAAISTRALDRPLFDTKWAQHCRGRQLKHDDRLSIKTVLSPKPTSGLLLKQAFSCVAYLEGGFDLDPESFETAFALAFEESIYFSMKLTCDPWDSPSPYEIKRVTGNVGRSGLALLIPPKTPMILDRNETSWRLMTNTQFNGKPENHFSKTSMHLSFTEYYVPLVQSGDVREQDSQVFLLESIVSVYDSGRWIGDVDVLKCLNSGHFLRKEGLGCTKMHEHCTFEGIASAETWDDVLDPPLGDCVIRAQGSWLARLATATIFIQSQIERKEEAIAIFSSEACWQCLGSSNLVHQYRGGLEGSSPSLVRIPGIARVMLY